jgi:pseudaminic acid cytidylyltransferase
MKARHIAVIPARGGSKRIPRKNIRLFHGKPLIAYSIEAAKASGLFDRIVVSTDDEEIAKVAKGYGAEIPFLRDAGYADDHTTAADAVEHTLQRLERLGETIDYACAIYPTAPLLEASYLAEGLEKLKHSDAWYAFSATSMPFPIWRTFRLTNKGRCEMFWPEHFATRSQDLEEAYQDAGQFYWERRKAGKPPFRFDANALPVLLPRWMVQDIDTPEDWERAEMMYRVRQEMKTR